MVAKGTAALIAGSSILLAASWFATRAGTLAEDLDAQQARRSSKVKGASAWDLDGTAWNGEAEHGGETLAATPSGVARENILIDRGEGEAGPGLDTQTDREGDVEEAEHSIVRFAVIAAAGEGEAAVEHLLIVNAQGRVTTRDWSARGLEERLAVGPYEAALVGTDGLLGPTIQFEVLKEPVSVELQAPERFDLAMTVFSHPGGERLHSAHVRVVRLVSEAFAGLGGDNDKSVPTDSTGRAVLVDLARGRWRVEIGGDGHAASDYELNLPGRWSAEVAGRTLADLGPIDLVRADPVGVRLVGHAQWGNASGFEVAHTAEGERVRFDENGEATLSIALFGGAELLKFWYPGGQFGLVYLDAGLPQDGKMYEADVRTSRKVEVTLQVSEEIAELIGGGTPLLRVTFRTERGDSFVVGRKLDGLGVHSVVGVHGDRAIVEFSAAIEGEHVVFTTESIAVRKRGTTTCTLVVDHSPHDVRFVDGAGEPLSGMYVQVRELGDATSWLAAATTGEDGVCSVPNNAGFTYCLRVVDDPRRLLVVDQELRLQPHLGVTEAVLDFTSPRLVEVFVDGEPKEGILVEVQGRGASAPLWFESTNHLGKTEPWRVSRGSDLFVRVNAEGFWSSSREFPFEEGSNRIDLFSTASLRVPTSIGLEAIRHNALGATLADWKLGGLLGSTADDSSGRSFAVPVGDYVVELPSGEPWIFRLQAGETKSL